MRTYGCVNVHNILLVLVLQYSTGYYRITGVLMSSYYYTVYTGTVKNITSL